MGCDIAIYSKEISTIKIQTNNEKIIRFMNVHTKLVSRTQSNYHLTCEIFT